MAAGCKRVRLKVGEENGRLVVAMIHATPAPTARDTSAQASGLGNDGD